MELNHARWAVHFWPTSNRCHRLLWVGYPLELTPDILEGANAHAIQIIPKQLGSNATASRWKALHKIRYFTIISQKLNN